MDLSNVLSSFTSNETANALSKKLNIDSSKVSTVISAALPTMLQGMHKNTQTADGAASLNKALSDHANNSSSALSNLQNADAADGSKILGKIFGGNASSVFSSIAAKTGTSSNDVSSILSSLAPSLLSVLGKTQQGSNVNAGGLNGMLGSLLSSGNIGSIVSSAMADKDGDGTPDILNSIGSLFGKK